MIKALSSVVLELGMNTSLLSEKRLSVESHLRRAFPSWERRRIEAEAGRRPWNLKQCQVTSCRLDDHSRKWLAC